MKTSELRREDHDGSECEGSLWRVKKKTWKEEIEKIRKEKTAKNEKTFEDLD